MRRSSLATVRNAEQRARRRPRWASGRRGACEARHHWPGVCLTLASMGLNRGASYAFCLSVPGGVEENWRERRTGVKRRTSGSVSAAWQLRAPTPLAVTAAGGRCLEADRRQIIVHAMSCASRRAHCWCCVVLCCVVLSLQERGQVHTDCGCNHLPTYRALWCAADRLTAHVHPRG